jgi:hypothetical protein
MNVRPPAWVVAGLIAFGAAQTLAAPVVWRDAAQASSALRRFEAQLDSHDSATAVLQAWCDSHHLAPGARITARQVQGALKPPSPAARAALALKPGMPVRYRRVDLACGDHVLSQADNWYLPSRLTPDMNRRLDQTQTPFGVAVGPLGFHRRTLSTRLLFTPSGRTAVIPHAVLQHSAVLSTRDGAPFSFVVETYTDQVLAFAPR